MMMMMTMMRAVNIMTDPLDRLLREAAGNRPDPELSRRAIRASLRLNLGRRRQREARARLTRPLALAAVLMVALCGQLGSDDFRGTFEAKQRGGTEFRVFEQGLRKQQTWVSHHWTDVGLDDADVEELSQQGAADAGILVGLKGWQVGPNRHFSLIRKYVIDGHVIVQMSPLTGQSDRIPAWLKDYIGGERTLFMKIEEAWVTRGPDITTPMYFDGLAWIVNGWRFRFPGREEIIYYRGERVDGVRVGDDEGF